MIGVDEVGRGCWAGPMLVVASREITPMVGLKDSKKLSEKKRKELFQAIPSHYEIGEGWVEPQEIDERGLTEATRLGVKRALEALQAAHNEEIIIDGNVDYSVPGYTNIAHEIKAEDKYACVAAASIAAKVVRDNFMVLQSQKYPQFGFEKHVGYGTAAHVQALKEHGVCELHRKSYKPIQKYL